MEITPTKSVIEGWNGTVAGVTALAQSLERSVRIELFARYGNHVFESFEDFCYRMTEAHGDNWVSILKR